MSESSVVAANAGNMFELFRTFEGEEFTVYVREDGKKFYVDFEEQKWRYFPDAWGDRGNFLPIDHDPYQVGCIYVIFVWSKCSLKIKTVKYAISMHVPF